MVDSVQNNPLSQKKTENGYAKRAVLFSGKVVRITLLKGTLVATCCYIQQKYTKDFYLAKYVPQCLDPAVKAALLVSNIPVYFAVVSTTLLGFSKYKIAVFVAPVAEELGCRCLFQQIVLKKVPKFILDQSVSKNEVDWDSTTLKTTRVVLTAFIFAMGHSQSERYSDFGGVPQLVSGVVYSGLIERGDSIKTTIVLHMLWNSFWSLHYLRSC